MVVATPSIDRKAFMLVLSSPSGAGKTALARHLLSTDHSFVVSVSVTTRPPRRGEVDGKDYYFVDDGSFNKMVDQNELLEHAQVFSYRYGTRAEPVRASLAQGKDVLFDIDWQGAQQLRNGKSISDHLVTVFILPPSMTELSRRLKARELDSDDEVRRRMLGAAQEISHWEAYDYILINDDFDRCFASLYSIVKAERARRQRQPGLSWFVSQLTKDSSSD